VHDATCCLRGLAAEIFTTAKRGGRVRFNVDKLARGQVGILVDSLALWPLVNELSVTRDPLRGQG
jgi:hypothetical protein